MGRSQRHKGLHLKHREAALKFRVYACLNSKIGNNFHQRDGGWDGGRGYGGRGRGLGRGYSSEDMQQESGGCNDYGGSGVAPTRGRGRGQGRGRGRGHGRGWDFRSDGPVQATA
ncbi:hypothetical protein F0562_027491 [Nyssa sinensis]|uniref:Uncharacterized protein n=1 Tax=Nyssa sinensis TaxID=561372 RepID=A0A5J5B5F3_9ASTE|nr:hypothetical protein F0562_027491 [Nyssa sinensis]